MDQSEVIETPEDAEPQTMQQALSSVENPISMRALLEAGVHFGHQTKRWNPKMKPYIFGARNGIHIIDLQHTVRMFNRAYNFIVNAVAQGGTVLFVGTKKQSQEVIQEEARRSNMYFVTNRWLGGTLTNFRTVKGSIERLHSIEKMAEDGTFERLNKKEVLMLTRERDKLEKSFGGIKLMTDVPNAIFVVDAKKEHIAISEARKLKIPVVAIADTNCDPDVLDYVIPGNDDAIRAIKLFTAKIADACILGTRLGRERAAQRHDEERSELPRGGSGDGPKVEMARRRGLRSTPAAAATPTSVMVADDEDDL